MSRAVNRLTAFGRTLPVLLALACPSVVAVQQQTADGPPAPDAIAQLLELPAPPPPPLTPRFDPEASPDKWMSAEGVPVDEAPPAVLLDFWWARQRIDGGPKPSVAARRKLLQAVEKETDRLPHMLEFLPDDADAHERVKRLLDAEQASPKLSPEWVEAVRGWLMLHSRYFREELVRAAQTAEDDESMVRNDDELRALVALDSRRAKLILETHLNGGQPRTAALALSLLYKHAVESDASAEAERLRARLRRLVEDKSAPGGARDTAAEVLLTTEWAGRDEWYLSLFKDETLREMLDGDRGYAPLDTPVQNDPERWIPVLTRLVGNADRAVHDAAVSCLVSFNVENARRDALEPLLPWLSDPKWSSADDRLLHNQCKDRVELPESVPGLISIVENEERSVDRAYAAAALAHYRDPRAGPALKKALEKEKDEYHRRLIIKGLLACDGLTDAEIAEAVEAYAVATSTTFGRKAVENVYYGLSGRKTLPHAVSLGESLARHERPPESAAEILLGRARELERIAPSVARALLKVVHRWPVKVVDLDIVGRLARGAADAETVSAALERRERMRQNVAAELVRLYDSGGVAAGVAAVLLNDPQRQLELLGGKDREAQRALLACARLVREPLPVEKVGALLREPKGTLTQAAERYLESEDSPAARRLVLAQHPGEALILGARKEFDPGLRLSTPLNRWEWELRDSLKLPGGPEEVFAFFEAQYEVGRRRWVVNVRGGRAELLWAPTGTVVIRRKLPAAELQRLRLFVSENGIDDLPPVIVGGVSHTLQYQYVHLTRDGGRRVFMDTPFGMTNGKSIYHRLGRQFYRLTGTSEP